MDYSENPSIAAFHDVKTSFYTELAKFDEYKPLLLAGDAETKEKARLSLEHLKRMIGVARVLAKDILEEQERAARNG